MIYVSGKNIKKDLGKAFDHVKSAADQNFDQAQALLGYMYLFEMKELKDVNKGIEYLELAAKQHNIDTDYFAYENYDFDKNLPWDFIEISPGKEFLINENKRLIQNSEIVNIS